MSATHRPRSINADWEEPAGDGEPFNYDAVPTRFYIDVEAVGQIPPQEILEQGIKYLQEKLAAIIQGLTGADANVDGFGGGARSPPGAHGANGNGGPRDDGWGDPGYTTPFQSGGRTTYDAWNNGGTTPYGGGSGGANW